LHVAGKNGTPFVPGQRQGAFGCDPSPHDEISKQGCLQVIVELLCSIRILQKEGDTKEYRATSRKRMGLLSGDYLSIVDNVVSSLTPVESIRKLLTTRLRYEDGVRNLLKGLLKLVLTTTGDLHPALILDPVAPFFSRLSAV
jgi:hypothetical protein